MHRTHTHTNTDLIKYAATPPNQLQRCILTDYFNNYNFSKVQLIRSLMMVIKLKHAGARRRKNQRMTQVKMFIHFRLTQHVLGIIMPIGRRQTE